MCDNDIQQNSLFSYSKVSYFVPSYHLTRRIRALAEETLKAMAGTFTANSFAHGSAIDYVRTYHRCVAAADEAGQGCSPIRFSSGLSRAAIDRTRILHNSRG